ncbi:MAG: hypothetical protein R3309_08420 [Reinekea sp.]|jgi:hypothetical protein|nr:hypothetical protein [Reinekea sp.]
MKEPLLTALPVPPALVYLLHQLRANDIKYLLYGEIPGTDMVFVDIDRQVAGQLQTDRMPDDWSVISSHFLSQRALERGESDPIIAEDFVPEAVVIAYGGREAEQLDNFQALCEQVRYLRQQSPSRLVYHNRQPPEPMEIHHLIEILKVATRAQDD